MQVIIWLASLWTLHAEDAFFGVDRPALRSRSATLTEQTGHPRRLVSVISRRRELDSLSRTVQPFLVLFGCPMADLLADLEHLGAAGRAYALGRRSLVLHDDAPGVLDLFLGSALHAIRLHWDLLSTNEMVGYLP